MRMRQIANVEPVKADNVREVPSLRDFGIDPAIVAEMGMENIWFHFADGLLKKGQVPLLIIPKTQLAAGPFQQAMLAGRPLQGTQTPLRKVFQISSPLAYYVRLDNSGKGVEVAIKPSLRQRQPALNKVKNLDSPRMGWFHVGRQCHFRRLHFC